MSKCLFQNQNLFIKPSLFIQNSTYWNFLPDIISLNLFVNSIDQNNHKSHKSIKATFGNSPQEINTQQQMKTNNTPPNLVQSHRYRSIKESKQGSISEASRFVLTSFFFVVSNHRILILSLGGDFERVFFWINQVGAAHIDSFAMCLLLLCQFQFNQRKNNVSLECACVFLSPFKKPLKKPSRERLLCKQSTHFVPFLFIARGKTKCW